MSSPNRNDSKIKVLFLDHSAVRESEQAKYKELAMFEDMAIQVLTPFRWREVDREIQLQQSNGKLNNYELIPSKTLFTGFQHRSLYSGGIVKVFQEFQPDIIFVFSEPSDFWVLQTIFLRKIICPDSKIIFHSWQNINFRRFPYKMSFIYSFIERLAYRYCEGAAARNGEAERVLRIRGFNKKIKKIYWGIDESTFAVNNQNRPKKKEELTIGYVGRFVAEKGLDCLLQAADKLNFEFTLWLIGSGPEKRCLEALASSLKIHSKVKFIDVLPQKELIKYYRLIDVLVLPSLTTSFWKEQFGRVLVEAMACGIPVIGSSTGAIPEVIADAGLIFEENNAEDLAHCLMRLKHDKQLKEHLIEKGHQRFEKKFTWKKFAQSTYELCIEVLRKNEDN